MTASRWLAAALLACDSEPPSPGKRPGPGEGACDPRVDRDGDGASSCEDCADWDDRRHPGAAEVWYDGDDQDCDGTSDFDQDGDGMDAEGYDRPRGHDCDDIDPAMNGHDLDGDGFSPCTGDCDDADPARHPGAYRDCGDGIDNDCDALDDCELAGDFSLPDPRHLQILAASTPNLGDSGIELADDDGDGVRELFVGTAAALRGDVYVFETDVPSGSTEAAAGASFSSTNWVVGDLTGDGLDDGASLHSGILGPTLLYVYAGPLVGSLEPADAASLLEPGRDGAGRLNVGDPDADGYADLWSTDGGAAYDFEDLGVPIGRPSVWLIRGPVPPSGGLEVIDAVLYSERERATPLVEGNGADLDGDGDDDLVVTDLPPDGTVGPDAYVVPGHEMEGTRTVQDVGHLLHGPMARYPPLVAGDVDQDGYQDLSVWLADAAGVALLLGPIAGDRAIDTAEITLLPVVGQATTLGDVNDDGYTDLAVGDDDNWEGGPFRVMHGPVPTGVVDVSEHEDLAFEHVPYGDPPVPVWLGSGCPMGDVDEDGVDDFALVAGTTGSAPFSAVYLIYGAGPGG